MLLKPYISRFFTVLAVAYLAGIEASAQNYDESKVPAYSLPNMLTSHNGKAIKDTNSWEIVRRPEILKLFEDNIYGQMPRQVDSTTFNVKHPSSTMWKGRARLKEIVITAWRNRKQVQINLTLLVPSGSRGPVPTFLLINNRDRFLTDPHKDSANNFWPAAMMIDSGYAMAAFHVNDAAPDAPEDYHKGVLQLYPDQLKAGNGMKAVGAWAWAAITVMDYLEKDPDIDSKRIVLVGHSRGGKAALWAGAQDKRFAIVIANNSGNTGAAISRRKFGETIKAINTRFPHWFADNYKRYNDNEAALPVDQHMLVALIAPRPVYTTSATEDLWADPTGSYLSLLSAVKVYDLYARKSTLTSTIPEANKPIVHSTIGYHLRQGIHDMTSFDWQQFARFGRYHFDNRN
jgi:hypothetical protein